MSKHPPAGAKAPPGPKQERSATGPRIWCIIPARYGSTRFPGKPLAMLAGKPMIQHTYERTSRTPSLSRVLVATDDERIRDAVTGFGGRVVMTGAHATGTDRIAEAVERETRKDVQPDWVLNVQGDEPLVDPGDLERLIQGVLAKPGAVMGTLVHPLRNDGDLLDPNIVKAVLDKDGRALYFSRSPIPHPRGAGERGLRHLGVYLYRTDYLFTFHQLPPTPLSEREQLEQLRALEHGHSIHCFEATSVGFGVDVPEQLAQVEALLADG